MNIYCWHFFQPVQGGFNVETFAFFDVLDLLLEYVVCKKTAAIPGERSASVASKFLTRIGLRKTHRTKLRGLPALISQKYLGLLCSPGIPGKIVATLSDAVTDMNKRMAYGTQ